MKDYFINLSESILDSFGANKRVQVECAMSALNVDIDTAVPLGLIVNELLTNTIKYSLPRRTKRKSADQIRAGSQWEFTDDGIDNGVGKSGKINGTGFAGSLYRSLPGNWVAP